MSNLGKAEFTFNNFKFTDIWRKVDCGDDYVQMFVDFIAENDYETKEFSLVAQCGSDDYGTGYNDEFGFYQYILNGGCAEESGGYNEFLEFLGVGEYDARLPDEVEGGLVGDLWLSYNHFYYDYVIRDFRELYNEFMGEVGGKWCVDEFAGWYKEHVKRYRNYETKIKEWIEKDCFDGECFLIKFASITREGLGLDHEEELERKNKEFGGVGYI